MRNSFLILTLAAFVSISCGENRRDNTHHFIPGKPLDPVEKEEKYGHIDPSKKINEIALNRALEFYDANLEQIDNSDYLTVIDFSLHSSEKRFYLIDMFSGEVEARKTAHGKGSDTNNDGIAERFSNTPNSNMTSLGFYRASEIYWSTKFNNWSLRLDGLSSTNSNARSRAIVIHPASYVDEDNSWVGRSWGCPALDPDHSTRIIEAISEGSVIYAWSSR